MDAKVKTNEFSFYLAPSKLEGVGVFAFHDIPANTLLRIFDDFEPLRNVEAKEVSSYFLRYGVKQRDGSWALPGDVSRMSIGWFLNHSRLSNVGTVNDWDFYSTRDISAGEELLIDYATLEDDFSEECDPQFPIGKTELEVAKELIVKLEEAFDCQTRELETALEFLTSEQLSEFRQKMYPTRRPRSDDED